MSWKKYRKIQNFFYSNRKRSYTVTYFDKDGNESVVTISYKKIIDSATFMASSLSNIVDDLAEGINVNIVIVFFFNMKV